MASDDQPVDPVTVPRRIMIMISVVIASTLYSTTLLIASALLPQMQGAMAATPDEIAWTMTFNILATAVATPMTGWLVASFGRRNVMVGAMALFSLATYLCGAAESLESLVIWRMVQGAAGAPVTPLSQTVLFDSFPRRQHRMITSVYGMTVVIGPVIGPALGGYISELYSWRWAFYGLVPVGVLSCVGLQLSMLRDPPRRPVRLDWIGFLSLAAAISCVQLVLSRGQRLDWYESQEIWLATLGAGLAFYIFVAHSVTAERPFLNPRLVLDRNYALGLLLVGVFGMLNVTPMVLLPPLLQQHAGFPDSLIGEVLAARGAGATLGFFAAMFLGRLDPRIGMGIGFGLQVISGLWLMSIDLNVTMEILMANSMLQGMAIGVIWVPLTIASFATLDNRYWAEAMAVFHLLRNIGSSFFISLCVADIVRVTARNYSRMTEQISPFNERLNLPWVMGGWSIDSVPGLARLSKELGRQAALIGYLDAFALYTAASGAAVLLVLLVRRRRAAGV
ncbi:MAG: DHA2 family efflux MFS transporter permease subunit [Alphaproteobacteria bacterium]